MTATLHVRSPWSGDIVGQVPLAQPADVARAVATASDAASAMASLPAHDRARLLHRAAAAIERDARELASTITAEQGKRVGEADAEASRIAGIVRLCAEESVRLEGRVLALDAVPAGVGRLAYTRPQPTGIVVAITPFNYPAILVIHKIGPALAAGNPVLLKPAGATPLTARFLVDRLRRRLPTWCAAARRRPRSDGGRCAVRRRARAKDLLHRQRTDRPRDRARCRREACPRASWAPTPCWSAGSTTPTSRSPPPRSRSAAIRTRARTASRLSGCS